MILLIELLNGALVDTIALVDHVAGGGEIPESTWPFSFEFTTDSEIIISIS